LAHPVTETRPPMRDVAPPATLSAPAPVAVPPSPQPRTEPARPLQSSEDKVHGPSFLGLSEDPKVEFSYLYEDEPTRSHAGMIVVLLMLIGAGGFLAWQWRHNGYPFNRLNVSAPASPAPASPDASQSQATQADKSATGGGDTQPAAPDQKTTTDAASNSTGAPTTGQEADGSSKAAPAPTPAPAKAAKKERASAPPPASPSKSRARAKIEPTHAAAKPVGVENAALATPPDNDLELAGERYLYGTGLPQNCARAESSLRTAATHGNSKAETVLGTMYATGHCVGRDLPAAYRWFARALHQEPQNSRISADLQVLWRQMTPEEKQLATNKQ